MLVRSCVTHSGGGTVTHALKPMSHPMSQCQTDRLLPVFTQDMGDSAASGDG
jgi:hypothetical protein